MGRDNSVVSPLRGVRVLDLSQVLAGPYCAMLLAGLGAEVIKIEAPEGDLSRQMGPPFVGDSGTLFLSVNRNKKSLSIDLKRLEGQEVLHRLVLRSDVLIHNFRPRAAAKLRVDYRSLSRLNPSLIYASVAAFGQSGPYVERPGLDAVLQAMGGMMSLTGPVNGKWMKAGASVVDMATGILTALGIVASLFDRFQSGKGCRVGGALLDTVVALQASLFTYSSVIGRDPDRIGNGSYFTITDHFLTSDGSIVISLPTARFWSRLCRALGDKRLAEDPRFRTQVSLIRNKDLARARLARIFRQDSTAVWLDRLLAEEVPCGPALSYHQVLGEPQVLHNGLIKWDHYRGRKYRVVRSPVRLNGRVMDGNKPARRLGQDTVTILRGAGFSAREIKGLVQSGAIISRP